MRKLTILLLLALCLVSYVHAEEFQTFETKHLVVDIPKDWIKVERDGKTYFYADGTVDNAVLMIFVNEFVPFADELAPQIYQKTVDSLSSQSGISDVYMEPLKICNQDAAYISFTMNSTPCHMATYAMASKGCIFSMRYTHSKENQNAKKELMTIVNSIRDKASASADTNQEEQPTKKPEAQTNESPRAEDEGVFVPTYSTFMNRLCEFAPDGYGDIIQTGLMKDGVWAEGYLSDYDLVGKNILQINRNVENGFVDSFEVSISQDAYETHCIAFDQMITAVMRAIRSDYTDDDVAKMKETLLITTITTMPVDSMYQSANDGVYRYSFRKASYGEYIFKIEFALT